MRQIQSFFLPFAFVALVFLYVSCEASQGPLPDGGAQELPQKGLEPSTPGPVEQHSLEPTPDQPGPFDTQAPDVPTGPDVSTDPDDASNIEKGAIADTGHVPDHKEGREGPIDRAATPDETPSPDRVPEGPSVQPDQTTPDKGTSTLYTRRVVGDGAPLASLDASGRLQYRRYANEGQSKKLHILPDFSYAGYKMGGVAIPTLPVRVTLSPGTGDALARIQAAIDKVSQRSPDTQGFRGAVLLKKGTYNVSDTLRIRTSGVVLRGEGQGKSGTILVATKRSQHDLIQIVGAGSGFGEVKNTRVAITSQVVPVGASHFEVSSTKGYTVGDSIVVLRTPNQAWINLLGMGMYGWTTSSYTIGHERRITAIQGNTVHIDIPIVDTMESAYGGGSIYKANVVGRLSQSGVEDMRLVSQYKGNTDEQHGWIGVKLSRATNSWVRRVTVEHFGYAAVSIHSQSNFNTVEEVAMIDPISQVTGGRRYPFNVSGGVGNLFQRSYARGGRHNFVTGARVTGPHVWLDCYATTNHNDDGPHHRWATGLLFDNTSSKALNVQNRLSSGTGHGWAGAQVLFWNALADTIICDAPKGAMNWAIGCVGKKSQGSWAPGEPFGWWESEGKAVKPRSLYLQQLADRLGAQAVNNITTPAQRAGRIWSRLATWAGEGLLANAKVSGDPTCATGIRSGSTCCASSCVTCGGSGCSGRPGGSSACCSGSIQSSGRSCSTNSPPCTLP